MSPVYGVCGVVFVCVHACACVCTHIHPFPFLPFLQHLPVEAQLPGGLMTNAPGRLIAGFQSYIAQWDGEGRSGLTRSAMPTISMVRVKSSPVQEDTVVLEVDMNCFLGRDWTWPV